ncbi:hypothetical protein GQY15_10685 [Rhodobacter sphaeroides]|uniref:hypothetical protein n=1 Tax=Cereibacter sphaeroides TaxID=1063 RepID=UPI0013263727|nr:hypothetical protein [Cereibacter sphaeroides]MWP38071.1 hypothetical protein [Cereibacter sphaeroides]
MSKMTKTAWRARADGWIAGRRVKAGDEVSLTAVQAKYEPVDPVEMVAVADAPAEAAASAAAEAAETGGRARKVRATTTGEEGAP